MRQHSPAKTILFLLCVSSVLSASYQSSAEEDRNNKEKITKRSHKTRIRVSNETKLTKIYYIDTKELLHTNESKRHLSSN